LGGHILCNQLKRWVGRIIILSVSPPFAIYPTCEILMRAPLFPLCLVPLLLTSVCFIQPALAPHNAGAAEPYWNQYRGPHANGVSKESSPPVEFGETTNIKWKTAIKGKAWSSPVVWGEQVWVTNAPADGKRMSAVCLDLNSGKVLHDLTVFEVEEPQYCHPMNSYATPTPVIEEGRLYVHFGTHGTACIDTATTEILWSRTDLNCDHFRGAASSPIVHGNLLVVAFDGFDKQFVAALNKKDGTDAWIRRRAFDYNVRSGDNKKAYCTASVITVDGKQQIICPAAIATEAFSPTGDRLWTVRHGGMNASARPLYDGQNVFITNGMGGMVAVDPRGTGDITAKNIAWSSTKRVPKKSSMLLIDGSLYMVSDDGIFSSVDPATGKVHWSKRLGGEFAASPVYAGGHIYICNRSGDIYVVKPGATYNEVAVNKLKGMFMASPAVASDSLLLRTDSHLYCIAK